ncbi:hypothetical protein GGI07_005759 [Coemansia sp. Benny D115]|nr:hypothetical protein GGI07_005759 [Coemansia sp. Benny D115]
MDCANPFSVGDNLQLLCSAAAADAASTLPAYPARSHMLEIRQQPERSRVGSVSEKMDRRPIDPPPIIQLIVHDPQDPMGHTYTTNPAYFMQVVLMDEAGVLPLRHLKGHRATAMAGSMVSPLHTLRDMSNTQGAYFVFSDLSIRMEGTFRLQFHLYEIEADAVCHRATILSDCFSVYSPKRFPGMMESTPLSKLFSEQGLRIRIRTEAGTKKRARKLGSASESLAGGARAPVANKRPRLTRQSHGLDPAVRPPADPLATLSSSPESSLAHGASGQTLPPGHPSLLIFQHDPFSVYHCDKENVPPVAMQPCYHQPKGLFSQPSQPMSMTMSSATAAPSTNMPPNHALSLSDIAAVALLDSLGGNASRPPKPRSPPVVTDEDVTRLLAPSSVSLDQSYSAPFLIPPMSAASATADPGSIYHTDTAKPTHIQTASDPFTSSLHPSSLPFNTPLFSNYRIASSRTPDSVYSQGMFLGAAPRLHPTLRSSGGNSSLASQNSAAQLMALPQRAYTAAHSACVGPENTERLEMSFARHTPAQNAILGSDSQWKKRRL